MAWGGGGWLEKQGMLQKPRRHVKRSGHVSPPPPPPHNLHKKKIYVFLQTFRTIKQNTPTPHLAIFCCCYTHSQHTKLTATTIHHLSVCMLASSVKTPQRQNYRQEQVTDPLLGHPLGNNSRVKMQGKNTRFHLEQLEKTEKVSRS